MKTNTFNFLVFGGFVIICTTVYMRFIKERTTGPINVEYTEIKYYLYLFLILTFLLTLLFLIIRPIYVNFIEKRAKKNELKLSWHLKFLGRYLEKFIYFLGIYHKMLEALFNWLQLWNYKPMIFIFIKIMDISIKFEPYYRSFINIFYFLPPCLIAMTYLIEVIHKNFIYFPLSIFLMIFPLTIRLILYSTKTYCLFFINEFNAGIIVIKNPDGSAIFEIDNNFLAPEYQTTDALVEVFKVKKNYENALNLLNFYYSCLSALIEKKYYQIFSVTCWLISFSFMLYYILPH